VEIYAQWPAFENRSTAAPYTIRNNGGVIGTAAADQTANGGHWVLLGAFDADAGIVVVELNDAPSGYVIADAVRLVCTGPIRVLTSIDIEGPATVNENSAADYTCRAYYDDGTDAVVAADSWTETCAHASIDASGRLTTGPVDADEYCQFEASYSENGVSRTDVHSVTIVDAGAAAEMIVDNTDAGFSSGPAQWPRSSFTPGYYGSNYQYAAPGSGGKWARWTFEVAADGRVEIYAQWPAYENRSTAAPYTIRNNGGVIGTAAADQTANGGQWVLLGTFDATAGTLEVTLNDTPTGYVIADAVKLAPTGP
jgi:hypothetical protein